MATPTEKHFEEIKRMQKDFVIPADECYEIYQAIKLVRETRKVTTTLVDFLLKIEKHNEQETEYRQVNLLDIPF